MQTRGKERRSSSARTQPSAQQPRTEVRRFKRNSAATPATQFGNSPDHVLNLQFDSGAPTKPVGNKSRSRITSTKKKAKAPSKPAPKIPIMSLTPTCLVEIFKFCNQRERKRVLPLVCKHWADVLRAPSKAWETLVINTNDEALQEISFTRVFQWIKPRAESVINLTFEEYCVLEDEDRNPEAIKPSTIAAEEDSFRSILKAVAPTLQSLKINSCDAGLGFPLRWNILKDFNAASKSLTRLELLFIDDGNLTSAHVEDIKVFKNLVHLKLRWMPIWEYTYLDRTVMEASLETLRSKMSPLPINLFDLKHLETLHLDSEWLHGPFSFPRELECLKNLSELGLTNQNLSNLAFLPETLTKLTLSGSNDGPSIVDFALGDYLISNSRNLVELDLSNCNLKKFDLGYESDDVDEDYEHAILGSIQKLNLSNNNLLGPLPQISLIDNMLSLKHLNLSSCGLSVLPESAISCLNHLETLDLSFNNLVDLPPFDWHNNMKHMALHDNKFPTIPESLKKLRNLVTVDLGMCPYLEIPKSISEWLVALKHLVRFEASKVKGSDRSARFQVASLKWLEEAEKELEIAGRPGVLNYKNRIRIRLPLK